MRAQYVNGALYCTGRCRDGWPSGTWTWYDERGAVVVRGAFDAKGKLTGPWIVLVEGRVVSDPTYEYRVVCKGRVLFAPAAPGWQHFKSSVIDPDEQDDLFSPWEPHLGRWKGSGYYLGGVFQRELDAHELADLMPRPAR